MQIKKKKEGEQDREGEACKGRGVQGVEGEDFHRFDCVGSGEVEVWEDRVEEEERSGEEEFREAHRRVEQGCDGCPEGAWREGILRDRWEVGARQGAAGESSRALQEVKTFVGRMSAIPSSVGCARVRSCVGPGCMGGRLT